MREQVDWLKPRANVNESIARRLFWMTVFRRGRIGELFSGQFSRRSAIVPLFPPSSFFARAFFTAYFAPLFTAFFAALFESAFKAVFQVFFGEYQCALHDCCAYGRCY